MFTDCRQINQSVLHKILKTRLFVRSSAEGGEFKSLDYCGSKVTGKTEETNYVYLLFCFCAPADQQEESLTEQRRNVLDLAQPLQRKR